MNQLVTVVVMGRVLSDSAESRDDADLTQIVIMRPMAPTALKQHDYDLFFLDASTTPW